MRRWIVVRKHVTGESGRMSVVLAARLPEPALLQLHGLLLKVELECRVVLERAGDDSAHLVVVGAYGVPHGPRGPRLDPAVVERVARDHARLLLDGLAAELERACALLPGQDLLAEPSPAPVVRQLMDADAPCVDEDTSAADACSVLRAAGVQAAAVVDADGRLVGLLSERDLLAESLRRQDGDLGPAARRLTAGEVCTRPAIVTVPDLPAEKAARQMLYHGVHQLVVVEDGRLAGTVTRAAVFQALRRVSYPAPVDHAALGAAVRGTGPAGGPDSGASYRGPTRRAEGPLDPHTVAAPAARWLHR